MTLGRKKLNQLQTERFDDILNDALTSVHAQGKTIYVDSNTGSDSYNGFRRTSPVATLAKAYSLATASQGDIIRVMPFHTETCTAVLAIAKAGVRIIGETLGAGLMSQRPVITINGAVDLFSITAAGVEIAGLKLTIASTDAATALVNIGAANAYVHDLYMVPSVTSYNVVDCITLTADADECHIENIFILNKTVAVNSFLSLEGACSNVFVKNFRAFGDCATAGIIDAAKVDYLWLENVKVATIGTTIPAVTLDSNPEGVALDVDWLGTHTTIATNANMGNLMRMARQYVLEATDSSVQATNIVPALDTD